MFAILSVQCLLVLTTTSMDTSMDMGLGNRSEVDCRLADSYTWFLAFLL